ncbi:hypothetical protein M2164_004741 [Streptomyces sp. SAI-208]|uniref:hypothetical protein n=1 Tax=Streptomyces sp. SAI-208 TaxID=2940550 RepID=UPI002473A277|nr:hypothetical protein [Streptomyces sp. SAI-208]MDH6609106.1 hypothetical protein [Streptomyces sp. SAI-208]
MGSFQQGIRPSLLAFRTLARSTSACGAGPVDSGGQSHSRPPPRGRSCTLPPRCPLTSPTARDHWTE